MESLSPLTLVLLFLSGLVLFGWIFPLRLQSLLREKRALSIRLVPVSRGSSYASLQAIVLGLKGMKVEARAKEIIRYTGRLQGDFARFRNDFDLVEKHLGHAQTSYQSADRPIEQFGQKLLSAEIAAGDPATIRALERETG